MIRLPREHGATAIALACSVCGWAVSKRWAWEPAALMGATWFFFLAAQPLRLWGKARSTDAVPLMPTLVGFGLLAIPGCVLGVAAMRHAEPLWLGAIAAPGVVYGVLIATGRERAVVARLLGIAALSALGPAAFGSATGRFGLEAAVLWGALWSYFTLVGILIMARVRDSRRARAAVRVAAPVVLGASVLGVVYGLAHWLLPFAYAVVAFRAWVGGGTAQRVDPVRAGKTELALSLVPVILIAAGLR